MNALRSFVPALVFALFANLLGQGVGVAFGVAEESMKGSLKADAEAVLATTYGGDAAKAKSVVDKSWVYFQRSHLHAGALGTFALALTLLLTWLAGPLRARQACATAVAAGAVGYGLFWLLAGIRAPGLGGTGVAKESLAWLAWPSVVALVGGTVGALMLVLLQLRHTPPRAS